MRALVLLLALPLLAPAAHAIPPCLDVGPSVTVTSTLLGESVTVTDPNCYVWGAPWYSLYDMGVPSHTVVALP